MFKVLSLLESLKCDVGQVKQMVQKLELTEKPGKMVQLESFKRLQDKVKDHGELLTKLKNVGP